MFIITDKKNQGLDMRIERIIYSTETAETMSWGFLVLTLILIVSVIVLIHSLQAGKKRLADLSSAFDREANHLSCILIFFCTTYLARFCSDYWAVPWLLS